MSGYPARVVEEVPATIEDFFSDENESSSDESEGSDITMKTTTTAGVAGLKKKKKKKKAQGPTQALPPVDLTVKEFRKQGKELIDFLADYLENARDRAVNHSAIPGYLFKKMPRSAPKEAVKMDKMMKDIEQFILPGIPQWQSPKHHAFLPAGGSFASLLGGLLCDGLGCVSLTWHECPAAVELEMLVMNWLAQLIDLPMDFHFYGKGTQGGGGGGIIQGSTSETLLTVMASAKRAMLTSLHEHLADKAEWELQDRLLAYCSEQAHPCMERIAEIIGVRLKRVWTDRQGVMHCNNLKSVMDKDRSKGFFPFIVVATAGTISCGSLDQIEKMGPMIHQTVPKVWFHIDASYAGSAVICREYHAILHGISYADSITVTVHKWLPIHMDCSCLWVKSFNRLTFTFACQDSDGPLTLPPDKSGMAAYWAWGVPMNRRFRAMKIWVVFNLYGVKKLQQKIREEVRRAKELASMMSEDHRFEVMGDVMFGIVAFRCKRPDKNEINHEILREINKSAVIKMTGAKVSNKFWLRFVVAGHYTDSDDVRFSWEMIKRTTNKVIADYTEQVHNSDRCGMPTYKHLHDIGEGQNKAQEDVESATNVPRDSTGTDRKSSKASSTGQRM